MEQHTGESPRLAIGIDVGGTGIKGAAVDLDTGEKLTKRHKSLTPEGGLPEPVAASVAEMVDAIRDELDENGILDRTVTPKIGVTLPGVVQHGIMRTAANIDQSWIDLDAVFALEPYWDAVRGAYRPFESGLPSPTGRVYTHEIPGGQLSNLRQQASALGLADNFEKIEDMYAAADRILGRIPKVTPSSKVVGDLALHLVAVDADPSDFEENPGAFDIPDSVVGFMAGELGELPGGWPEPFRSKVLAGRTPKIGVADVPPEDEERLAAAGTVRRETLNRLLFPAPARSFADARERFGDLSVLTTGDYLYGLEVGAEHAIDLSPGVRLYVGLEAIGEADDKGVRTVMTRVNGQLRPVFVKDESVAVASPAAEKADRTVPGQVGAPFSGTVTLKAQSGGRVEAGDPIATIEAMKMEAAITAPVSGRIERLVFEGARAVEAGDLLVVIAEE